MSSVWTSLQQTFRHYRSAFGQLAQSFRSARSAAKRVQQNGGRATFQEHRLIVEAKANKIKLVPFTIMAILPAAYIGIPALVKLLPSSLPKLLLTRDQKILVETSQRSSAQSGSTEYIKLARKMYTENTSLRCLIDGTLSVQQLVSSPDNLKCVSEFIATHSPVQSLPSEALVALCRLLGGISVGPTPMLRRALTNAAAHLTIEDEILNKTNLDALTDDEVHDACCRRGVVQDDIGVARKFLRDWLCLQLSLKHNAPIQLLLLVAAITSTHTHKLK